MNDSVPGKGSWASILAALLVGQDLGQAQRRVRWAWVAGFLWAAWSFIGVMAGIWSLAPEVSDRLDLRLFILAVLEVGLVAFLSYGVMRRWRPAAAILLAYFWPSRIFWIVVGAIALGSMGEIAKFLILQAAPAYLFLQGMRGVWTHHYLTHPDYPAADNPQP